MMLKKIIKDAASIAIGGHIRPDGDCVGSCLGLYQYLTENETEKQVDVYLEEIPDAYAAYVPDGVVRHQIPEERSMIFSSAWTAVMKKDLAFLRHCMSRPFIHAASTIMSAMKNLQSIIILSRMPAPHQSWCTTFWNTKRFPKRQRSFSIWGSSMTPACSSIPVRGRLHSVRRQSFWKRAWMRQN